MHSADSNVVILSDVDLDSRHLYGIAQVAKRFDLTMRTIRFYCELGLISECARSGGRNFDVYNVKRLALIVKAKFLGFPLQQISSLIVDGSVGSRDPILVIPAAEIDRLIHDLTSRRQQLSSHLQALLNVKLTEMLPAA